MNKQRSLSCILRRAIVLVACLAWASAPSALADGGTYTQTFDLQPGWNAVFVEVRPEPADIETVFAGLPIESVWGWFPTPGGAVEPADPVDGLQKISGWRGFFPRPRPEALLTDLFALEANRAYLVKLAGDAPVTLRISGRPMLLPFRWQPDTFNLLGLHVDPAAPPSFGAYFASSSAHAGRPVYRLDAEGIWRLVERPFSTSIRSGEAYWIYSDGPSSFQGPLEVATDAFEGLEYSATLNLQRLTVRNLSAVDVDVRLRLLPSPTPVPLALETIDDLDGSVAYPDLPTDHTVPVVPGQALDLGLGVRRAELVGDRGEQLIEVTDGLGSRRLVFLGATRVHPSAGFSLGAGGTSKSTTDTFAGLWVGQALVGGVSEAQQGGVDPVSTGEAFPLRLLVHVDAEGTSRLCKEVIQMWQDGTTAPCPDDPEFDCVDEPGTYVLVTDDSRISSFSGVALRDGQAVGLRYSTVAYDFEGTEQAFTGSFGSTTGFLEVELEIGPTLPTHPYKHQYHPDHDNLDVFFNPISEGEQEVQQIVRRLELEFASDLPDYEEPPGWGDQVVGGTYREEITGLHRHPIHVEGLFLLERVAATPELNP